MYLFRERNSLNVEADLKTKNFFTLSEDFKDWDREVLDSLDLALWRCKPIIWAFPVTSLLNNELD